MIIDQTIDALYVFRLKCLFLQTHVIYQDKPSSGSNVETLNNNTLNLLKLIGNY